MELLTVRHEDFTMYVECSKFESIFYPLCSLIREDEETMEADGDVIDEIASQYFCVR